MEFVRSIPAPRTDCNFGPREQVNQVTAWIDGSNVYASDRAEAKRLRLLRGGRLRVTRVEGGTSKISDTESSEI
jgi:peroxidase